MITTAERVSTTWGDRSTDRDPPGLPLTDQATARAARAGASTSYRRDAGLDRLSGRMPLSVAMIANIREHLICIRD